MPVTLNANALTSLEYVKMQIGILQTDVTQDDRLKMYINSASERIERWCDRKFKAQSHTDLHDGGRQDVLLLKQWPVNSITELKVDGSHVFGADSVIPTTNYGIGDDGNSLVYYGIFPRGRSNVKVVYNAGYTTIPSDVELACIWLVEWYYLHKNRGDMGRTSVSKGDESVGVLETLPKMIAEILIDYKRSEPPISLAPVNNYG